MEKSFRTKCLIKREKGIKPSTFWGEKKKKGKKGKRTLPDFLSSCDLFRYTDISE